MKSSSITCGSTQMRKDSCSIKCIHSIHYRCFKQCVTNNGNASLDANEHECVKNCLFKFNAVERLMIEKMRQIMQTYIQGDPNLKAALQAKQGHS